MLFACRIDAADERDTDFGGLFGSNEKLGCRFV